MFTELPAPLDGVRLLEPRVFRDHRGEFLKTFHAGAYEQLGIKFRSEEEFYSISKKHALRGMHFQLPPHDHAKVVYCAAGRVLDVVLDLRQKSPTFGQSMVIEMGEGMPKILYIPSGLAHGFVALEENSLMIYQTSAVHAPSHDAGIRWDSFGFAWPVASPIISVRDQGFGSFEDFKSPF
jgi:dTDP-4-dehydrorhamnose 3,5-epimerase